jgi:large subunit ribosomal protein L9
MKVLLRSDVDGVGRRGDIVDVSGGFARNFLLPEGKALLATEGISSQATAMRKGRDLREARDHDAAESQAKILAGTTITISARAHGGGKLFGSVTAADVVEAILSQKGVEVDRKHVTLDEPIKEVSSTQVTLHLFHDVAAPVTVEVVAAD